MGGISNFWVICGSTKVTRVREWINEEARWRLTCDGWNIWVGLSRSHFFVATGVEIWQPYRVDLIEALSWALCRSRQTLKRFIMHDGLHHVASFNDLSVPDEQVSAVCIRHEHLLTDIVLTFAFGADFLPRREILCWRSIPVYLRLLWLWQVLLVGALA